uniref:Ribosome biogenesis protein WDR12 homolog n=1 Tax=Albugo laibachii Nc14 TaxID=890382 RepID=F0WC89_9STRA|nr:conserved hypothetical protein [Albugo laibachii Nc14]|eukprot:CCA18802.1 conserved hypothetical protein [Albugo laibachii Nc14]
MDEEGPQVRVRFITKDASISVTKTPIALPTRSNRHLLSKVINHLLNPSNAILFDFLIDGNYLRTSLSKYMTQHLLSEETILTLEYVRALPEPNFNTKTPHSDWVSAISVAGSQVIVTGSYDGILRIYSVEKGVCKAQQQAHEGAIKAVHAYHHILSETYLISTCGLDQIARIWLYDPKTSALSEQSVLNGHTNSVNTVCMISENVLTGGWDHTVRLWTMENRLNSDLLRGKKRHKKNEPEMISKDVVLAGHSGPVTGVAFHPLRSECIVSASIDRSVRIWDTAKQECIQSMYGDRAITDLSVNAHTNIILTAHPDQSVRLWDPRASDNGQRAIQRTFQSHRGWVSSVEWCDSYEHLFASSGYDGFVKVWDDRCGIPLHSITAHDGKAFDVSWIEAPESDRTLMKLASGGEDCLLKIFNVGQSSS